MQEKCILVIPALNPAESLIEYVRELIAKGFDKICVVNDGSSKECRYIFDKLQENKECVVLEHAINYGKGRALKNAFNYCLAQKEWEFSGVITLDSDGQHLVEDVVKVSRELSNRNQAFILGSRDFSLDNIPEKSRFGNKLTSGVFRVLYGKQLGDTQTGLRGISKDILPFYLDLKGERFEYETTMLIETVQKKIEIIQIPITTVYENNNKGTHFDPIKDSLKIYGIILGEFFRYIASALISFLIDISLFELFFVLLGTMTGNFQIAVATVAARIISSLVNYGLNRNFVFGDSKNVKSTMGKYYLLVVFQMFCSAFFVSGLYQFVQNYEVVIKIVVDTILFFLSYTIQKRYIFKRI